MIDFILGMFVGEIVIVIIIALCSSGSDNDE